MKKRRGRGLKIRPKFCANCGAKLIRVRRTSWRRGYTYCPTGCRDWYGKG